MAIPDNREVVTKIIDFDSLIVTRLGGAIENIKVYMRDLKNSKKKTIACVYG